MDLPKSILLPLGAIALIGACSPYPPAPGPHTKLAADKEDEQALTSEQQRQIDESRERLKHQEEARNNEGNGNSPRTDVPDRASPPVKPKYPTASAVPGKSGFVFNPYTHNIVDVKGIGSGKLCRDPEDPDPTHKFRVP